MGLTILIVEDTEDTREVVRRILELNGFRVLEARSGLEAIDVALREVPDLILMDMSLPVMDGCQATRVIRARPELARVPIIACTAHNQWEWRGKGILAGCTDFMTKPLDAKGLVNMISSHLPQMPVSKPD
ncbi:MAG: response regulator [Acidobacteriota bacterium]|nr:response regulator [Acidobacteriota bacterium]